MADLKLKDLRYLVAIADTRHFGRAAERCFVSQPTLSAQLKKLEEYLGVQLIERQPRRVTLTEAGEEIVARSREMLQTGEEVLELARSHRDPLAGRLRVGLIPTVGPYLLPLVAQAARKALARLTLLLYEYRTEPLLEKLRAGELDLGILALPVDTDGLQTRDLFDEPFLLALPREHRLARRATLRIDDIAQEPLLLLEEGHCLRDQALAVCNRAGAQESQDFRATSLETLRQMVASGAGITLLPELACRAELTRRGQAGEGGVVVRPFTKPVPSRRVGAVWRTSTARRPAIDALCNTIAEQVKRSRV
ncbi:MAG TPA: LysR substrate-binding domain-containing protein [Steroidobacteraceae bacterium]|nr:LysR substrate-binding domain-containing protein [Steroidobacteraceae bacterium]